MEAPNKLFIKQEKIKVEMIPGGELPNVGIQYIRKDLLLEWAKAEIELSKRVECVSEKSYEEGRQRVAQNLIDKLNSM